MKRVLQFFFSRIFLVSLTIIIQIFLLLMVIYRFNDYFIHFYSLCFIISIITVVLILNNNSNPAYKLAWIIPILLFPIWGGLFYLLFGKKRLTKYRIKKVSEARQKTITNLKSDVNLFLELQEEDIHIARQVQYIQDNSFYYVHQNTKTKYFSLGEFMFSQLLEELDKAEKYIFMEYFIIQEGVMWNSILDILVKKARKGVIVRLVYDDMGSLLTLPYGYDKKLEAMGIKCQKFNPFVPFLSIKMNNRDHRKITVIDGHTAFTGGINLADEYINLYEKYGHWKDTGLMVKGEAVWNFTVMFLSLWEYLSKKTEDYSKYRYEKEFYFKKEEANGYVLPYSDSPMDNELVGETIYLNAINKAKKNVYIHTPYLILDNEMVTALCVAAKSGIDVRITTPHIADKSYVHALTRSYYFCLIKSGVKIYEYIPGFIHSKMFVVDSEIGIIGTINLDYRSLYLHFECGVWLYKVPSLKEMERDFLETLKLCRLVTLESCQNIKWFSKVYHGVLKIFAPLM